MLAQHAEDSIMVSTLQMKTKIYIWSLENVLTHQNYSGIFRHNSNNLTNFDPNPNHWIEFNINKFSCHHIIKGEITSKLTNKSNVCLRSISSIRMWFEFVELSICLSRRVIYNVISITQIFKSYSNTNFNIVPTALLEKEAIIALNNI